MGRREGKRQCHRLINASTKQGCNGPTRPERGKKKNENSRRACDSSTSSLPFRIRPCLSTFVHLQSHRRRLSSPHRPIRTGRLTLSNREVVESSNHPLSFLLLLLLFYSCVSARWPIFLFFPHLHQSSTFFPNLSFHPSKSFSFFFLFLSIATAFVVIFFHYYYFAFLFYLFTYLFSFCPFFLFGHHAFLPWCFHRTPPPPCLTTFGFSSFLLLSQSVVSSQKRPFVPLPLPLPLPLPPRPPPPPPLHLPPSAPSTRPTSSASRSSSSSSWLSAPPSHPASSRSVCTVHSSSYSPIRIHSTPSPFHFVPFRLIPFHSTHSLVFVTALLLFLFFFIYTSSLLLLYILYI